MPTQKEVFGAALREYASKGWRVIPCIAFQVLDRDGNLRRDKLPLIDWKIYQDRFPTSEEIERWSAAPFADYAGIEIVTGRYSPSMVVCGVDFDQKNGQPNFMPYVEDLADGLYTKTASGGYHYYFQHSLEIKNSTNLFDGDKKIGETIVDFRGQGGVMVVGPTPLWEHDPRSGGENKIVSFYDTPNLCRPEELLPLPTRFAVAMQAKTMVGGEAWRKVFEGKAKAGTRHDIAKSLIAKLLNGVTDADELQGVRDLVYAVIKTQFEGELSREEIENLFTWVINKEKQKRTSEYAQVKKKIKEEEFKKAALQWETDLVPVRAEHRGDLVTYFDQNDKPMKIGSEFYFSEATFRRQHLLEYGVLLPAITQKKFEETVFKIPRTKIVGESLSLDEVVLEILETWTIAKEAQDDEEKARKAALRIGYATYREGGRTILIFTFKAILPDFLEEGLRPKRSEISESFRSLKIKRANNLWKYDPLDNDAARTAL